MWCKIIWDPVFLVNVTSKVPHTHTPPAVCCRMWSCPLHHSGCRPPCISCKPAVAQRSCRGGRGQSSGCWSGWPGTLGNVSYTRRPHSLCVDSVCWQCCAVAKHQVSPLDDTEIPLKIEWYNKQWFSLSEKGFRTRTVQRVHPGSEFHRQRLAAALPRPSALSPHTGLNTNREVQTKYQLALAV